MVWLLGWKPCEFCGRRTRAKALWASGALRNGRNAIVWHDVMHRPFAEHVCDACWHRHLELERMEDSERYRQALAMVSDWLTRAPRIEAPWATGKTLSLPVAARQCTTAALYGHGDGRGAIAWEPDERRFTFSCSRQRHPLEPGVYDNVLERREFDGDFSGEVLAGSVNRVGDDILLTWRHLRSFDWG